jgi:hypothetical protein
VKFEKRLFWISIIIVELVLLYGWWRPHQNRFMRPKHRIAQVPPVPPVAGRPESKPTAIVTVPRKHWRATRTHVPASGMPGVVNASLKSPEPTLTKPVVAPQSALSPLESFWCHISMMDSDCDCKGKGEERANNLAP